MVFQRIIAGFVAGFVAVLVFHQTTLLLLHLAGVTPALPWRMDPVPPFGVPAVLSSAFWGGLWGILLAWLLPQFPRAASYWSAALLFGAVALSLVAWFVVLPLKGFPPGNGFALPGVITGLTVNGAWGIGTALFLRLPAVVRRPPK
ncbi:MAG: hypothetical protein ACOY3L_09900 [Pseudomonadota bacterium]